MELLKGRAWKFGDNMDTDAIVSGRFLDAPVEEAARHVFESIRPGFVDEVREGDVIVAGANFGCGSSRESAPEALKTLGIGCVVAESFGRIFFRNAIAIGLPAMVCAGVSERFNDGDTARVDVEKATVENLASGSSFAAEPLSGEMLLILESGGIMEVLKSMMGEER
ncbi:MAG: 3-isopropylmalate dehydratase [Actinomycetota bacterium]|nr:3-isopropylmalate dehydratase [Actinomycetota bacterium]